MRRAGKFTFEELVSQNKQKIMSNKDELEKITEKVEDRRMKSVQYRSVQS